MGIEPGTISPEKQELFGQGGAESGALALERDPDLARIVAAWPMLPEALRRGILAMIDAAK